MPRICQPQGSDTDVLMHLLYNGGAVPLLRALISESMQNIAEDFPTEGVREALRQLSPPPDASLACLRARFFLLLNQDHRMRTRLCQERVAGHLAPVCAHKACNLYDQLSDTVVTQWIKDERITLLDFIDRLKDAYLVA
jgi:hypothetical protein